MNTMNIETIIRNAEKNIRTALEDYVRHTYNTDNVEDVTDAFITRLAKDSTYAKQELRELFSKSPVWHPELDALVINGTRTHNRDYNRIYSLGTQILREVLCKAEDDEYHRIDDAISFFATPEDEEHAEQREFFLRRLNEIAPDAYKPGRKLSKVFRALCVKLGVVDDAAGSRFQRLYAQLADELNATKIDFKLFVSINPAHFLTMSNPKNDDRGQTMTSCHSFNNTDYSYNNGCAGYARDSVSFIVFTCEDPTDPESLNNRKTTRQVFAYRPHSGLLLQSRFYNKAGGVYNAAPEEANLYRDLIQREICALEDVPNLWKTYPAWKKSHLVPASDDFGGYADWAYDSFDCRVCVRTDCDENTVEPLVIGTSGLCIICGEETTENLRCDDCNRTHYCEHCCEYVSGELYTVYDRDGDMIQVCEDCLNEYYVMCERCGEYHHIDSMTCVDDYYWYCEDCLERECEPCDSCGEYHHRSNMTQVTNADGDEVWVCEDCLDEYYIRCDSCGEYHHHSRITCATNERGIENDLCPDCAEDVTVCPHCGENVILCDDGTCPACGAMTEEPETENNTEEVA